jgi:hypothetical protein
MFQPHLAQSLNNEFIEKSVIKDKIPLLTRYFFYSLLLLAFACKGRQEPAKVTDVVLGDLKKPDTVAPPETARPHAYKDSCAERAKFVAKNPTVAVLAHYSVPVDQAGSVKRGSYYFEGLLLVLRDTITKVADTLALPFSGRITDNAIVTNLTESLEFNTLLLKFEYVGDSDMSMSALVEVKNKKPKLLFDICDLEKISRKNKDTLVGVVRAKDELVYYVQDYPIIYCLKTDTLVIVRPDVQYIDGPSHALENITGRRPNGKKYTIKKGQEFTVDTLYRREKRVRITTKDSIPVYFTLEELDNKIYTDPSG